MENLLNHDLIPGHIIQVPEGHGIWFTFNESDNTAAITCEEEKAYPSVHPNCRAPRSLTDVSSLKGGGSGTAVFHGNHPRYKSIVMKHGGAKDVGEVLSLVEIARELLLRGGNSFLRDRLPRFVGVFISPFHLRDRATELWNTLRGSAIHRLLQRVRDGESDSSESNQEPSMADVARKALAAKRNRRDIQIEIGSVFWIEVVFRKVIFHLEHDSIEHGSILQGSSVFTKLKQDLMETMEQNFWKVTLAQEAIGDQKSINGATILVQGRLTGNLLCVLLHEFTCVVRSLQQLTQEAERNSFYELNEAIETIKNNSITIETVSKKLNSFVGSAIHKNYGRKGRLRRLRWYSEWLSSDEVLLQPSEVVPAKSLAILLAPCADFGSVFPDAEFSSVALDTFENAWIHILREATVLLANNKDAVECLWTCGLTDAGLHNTFLSENRGLELFDLGNPSLVSKPGFLTKFLMSFFHTMGMEDDPVTGWAVRFEGEATLKPTQSTLDRIPYLFETFSSTVHHFVDELFSGDERVISLLVKYVVLQLLSDASFCLDRWTQKGGGRKKFGSREKEDLSKWLWRSLWDIYIASIVSHHYNVSMDI